MNGVDPFNQLLVEGLSGARFATMYALGAAVLASFGVLAFFRREFVHTPADVDARLASFDHARDPAGVFA